MKLPTAITDTDRTLLIAVCVALVAVGTIIAASLSSAPATVPDTRSTVFPSVLLLRDLGFLVSALAFGAMAATLLSARGFEPHVPTAFAWAGGLFFLLSSGLLVVEAPLSRRLWLLGLVVAVAAITYALAWCQLSPRAVVLTREYRGRWRDDAACDEPDTTDR